MDKLLGFDGRSVKTVATGQAGLNDAYFTTLAEASTYRSGAVVGNLSALAAYNSVPWLYRAVNLRAGLVSRMPFALMKGETEVTDDAAYASIMDGFRDNLRMVELSLCLYGQAYLYLDANAGGRNIELRFIRSNFIKPHLEGGKLSGFDYTDRQTAESGIPQFIPLERIVYFWNPNMASAVKPGPGEVEVALGPASVLWAIDSMAAAYFNSGGVKVSVFSAPAGITDTDKEKFQNFLNRRMSGVWNAFKHIVIRNELKPPVVIGSDLKDTQAPELTASERQSVAVALGLAPPVIDMEHANKATAQTTMLALYTMTIIPRVDMLFDVINEQLFDANGIDVRLVTKPEELEEVQGAQLTQAASVDIMTGKKPVITQDEGRDLLGFAEMDDKQREELQPKPAPVVAAPGQTPPGQEQPNTALQPDGVNRPDVQAKGAASEQFEQMVKHYAERRKAAIAAIGQPVGVPFDDELAACKTAGEVRAVFERHWPVKPQRKTADDVAALLERALAAADKLA